MSDTVTDRSPADGPEPIDSVGTSGPSFEMDVELGKLREFVRATQAPVDPYLSDEAPPVPPTFLATSRLWERDSPWPKLGLGQDRVLHAEQEYVFPGPPPRVGSRLVGESTIEKVFTKDGRRGRMTFAIMVTQFRDSAGRVVAEARMTGVEMPPRNIPPPEVQAAGEPERPAAAGAEVAPSPGAPVDAPRGWGPALESAQRVSGEVAVPQDLDAIPVAPAPSEFGPLTITDFVRYQGASGDMNPLHHDPEKAKLAGFEGPISVGMLQAGLLGSYAVSWLGAHRIRRFRVRFGAPAFVGDVLTCGPLEPAASGDASVQVHLGCRRQSGELVAEAWATFSGPTADEDTNKAA